ncbi:MAG: fucose isomerase [Acidobacteriaceae bacterium]|nr:fucose isomerase [Acidobacteriaceae bacterium]MBV9781328.1 fucose isomerase [Acidobacteriaceae bacterium]
MFDEVVLIANGDLRLAANRVCWPAQEKVEEAVTKATERFGARVRRGHPYDSMKQHGFIDSQKYGMGVFRNIGEDVPIVVVEAVWQYSHHILHGLITHRGPILTIANWSGRWPGLVGMLNLNGSLTKAGVKYSTLWSEEFTDDYFLSGLKTWLSGNPIEHDTTHVRSLRTLELPTEAESLGAALARKLKREKAIMGVFDEGCMGMFNAIVPDDLLNPTGVYKERLSQSALYAAMREVSKQEAQAVRSWLDAKGLMFKTGPNPETDLTDDQILDQCRMYIAALRIADEFGCAAIGIQYQQGLKDLTPASDLAEGLLNNSDRPPVKSVDGRVLYERQPLPHFNEVDECAGLDALITNRVWNALGFPPETTLHDLRYGETFDGEFVWVFEISGAVPPAHNIGGYKGTVSERQPPMYFRLGGGTLKGVSKPGEIVWSRVFIDEGKLKADIGRARAIELPREETERRWRITTPQWPIMHAVLHGISRDQMMARHKANHIQVAYAPDAGGANKALAAKAAFFREAGLEVSVCGSDTGM